VAANDLSGFWPKGYRRLDRSNFNDEYPCWKHVLELYCNRTRGMFTSLCPGKTRLIYKQEKGASRGQGQEPLQGEPSGRCTFITRGCRLELLASAAGHTTHQASVPLLACAILGHLVLVPPLVTLGHLHIRLQGGEKEQQRSTS